MSHFYLRHTVYTRVEVDNLDEARVFSRTIARAFEETIDGFRGQALCLEVDREKDWELVSQDRASQYQDATDDTMYDEYTGRYFQGSTGGVQAAIVDTTRQVGDGETVTLNEFYDMMDLPPVMVGETMGWGGGSEPPVARFCGCLTPAGKPAIAISFMPPPRDLSVRER